MIGPHHKNAIGMFLLLAAFEGSAGPRPSEWALAGTVVSPAGQLLPDVLVALSSAGRPSRFLLTDSSGGFRFEGLPPGSYSVTVALPGYELYERTIALSDAPEGEGAVFRFEISLEIARISESVAIQAKVSAGERTPDESAIELAIDQLDRLPLPTDRFQEAFPLVPGVVRDPEGRLSFNGARPSQSTLLVNGANATDPLTGEFAIELPLRAIEAVEVTNLPYSAEYGQVTAAVAKVKTRGGGDTWDVELGDLMPKLNFRDGKIKGIRAAVPQVRVSGPLEKGELWFSQGVAARFVRSRVFDPVSEEGERILEGFDSFTQIDWQLAEQHLLTATYSYFPSEWDNYGMNALTSVAATPDLNTWGWNAAVSERATFAQTLVETIVSVKSFDVAVRPKSRSSSSLTPDGLRDNYFNIQNRTSSREEVSSVVTHAFSGEEGRHILKVGGSLSHTSFDGTDESLPVVVRRGDGTPLRRIEWVGDPAIGGSDLQGSLFVQEQWRPTDRLGFDLGLRYDYDRLVGGDQLAPRLAAAYTLDASGRTVIKGGYGVFFDHVQLHVASFEDYQHRIETRYDDTGMPLGTPTIFRNQIADAGLDIPRSTQWNVEVDRLLTPGLELRFNYRERRGSRELIVDRVVEAAGRGSLRLGSSGESLSRELDVTARVSARRDSELFLSYVKSRTTGDLNSFSTLYQNLRSPLILDNERSLLDLDVPHRVLAWGIWNLPKDIRVSPGLEWRSGFPYTVLAEDYTAVGVRNRDGRYPGFLSFDLRVTKGTEIFGRDIRVGFQFFNLASHFNPRDVISNLGSERFGSFLNSVDMSLGLRVSLGI